VKLADQRILITGASSGIGRAMVIELAAEGVHLALVARRQALLEQLAEELARSGYERPVVLVADLSQRGAATKVAAQAIERLGGVDILINNAGGAAVGFQWVVGDHDKARRALELNYWAPLALMEALVPAMRERDHGAVVNVTSGVQVMPLWFTGHYSASKAALAQVTQTLALELQGSGINVLEVIPGTVDTAMQREQHEVPAGKEMVERSPLGKPEILARLLVRALRRDRRRLIYPRAVAVGYTFPGLFRIYGRLLRRRLTDKIDLDDRRVLLGGSFGDPEARRRREAWERERLYLVRREAGLSKGLRR
jgi:short-subunit dehydrogenase